MEHKKIRFGVIGTNGISDWFLEGAAHVECFSLAAVYSRTEEKAIAFAIKHQVPNIFTSLREMAESDLIDAVYIASPNALHAEQTIQFLKHKKHVLCEKAFASNALEVAKMIVTAKEHDVILMEAIKTIPLPNFQVVKDHLHRIGKVRRYFGSFCQYSSRYDSYKEGIILNAFKPELSNGALMDIGVYCIHPMIHLFGKPEGLRANAIMLESGVDGAGCVVFEYEDMEGIAVYSKITNSLLPSEIQGEKGSLIIQNMVDFETIKIVLRDGTEEELSQTQLKDNMAYEINEFIQMIQNRDFDKNTQLLQISLEVMACMDEVRKQIGLVYPADQID